MCSFYTAHVRLLGRSLPLLLSRSIMPKVKRSRKRPPEGFELIEPTLDELDQKMREGKSFISTYFSAP